MDMKARDFIEGTLLPWLESELADMPPGNKAFVAGFNAAVEAMSKFIDQKRSDWDIQE